MDKYSKKILKYLNKNSDDDKAVPVVKIYNSFKIDIITINNSLDFLNNNGYVLKHCGHSGTIIYHSTSKGKDYFKDNFKNNLFNVFKIIFLDIFCPLLVAYITARITINNAITNNECCNESGQARNK